ncbi:MAG: ABC transporter permease [Anaerolineae bacterium]|nr:ABC transporter permease [Anaerolineae bacterium]
MFSHWISPRWRKAARDLWVNRSRTSLVVVAIAIGIFGVSMVLNAYTILNRELNDNYLATNPASATLSMDTLDQDRVQAAKSLPLIAEAEARRKIQARIQVGPDKWVPLWLFVIDDFDNLRVSTFNPEAGDWPPAPGEMLLERAAFQIAQAQIGDTVTLRLPDGSEPQVRIGGSLHDLGQAPAWMELMVYGYITTQTSNLLGQPADLNELQVVVADDPYDEGQIRSTVYQLKDWIEQTGGQVYRVDIPKPGAHVHYEQLNSFLLLLQAFGLLALVLSGVLVINMINSLLSGQIRQIGMMKAVGARTGQVMGIYFGVVMILGLAALLLAIPAGIWGGRAYAAFGAAILNFNIVDDSIPLWSFAIQIFVGLLVPLLAAGYPIYRSSHISVRQALSDYGLGEGRFGSGWLDKLLGRISGLARPLLISLRNTFRRRGRLVLTLFTLAMGGAIFMAALNIRASTSKTIEASFGALNYDIAVRFRKPYPRERLVQTLLAVPGVEQVEGWSGAGGSLVYSNGTMGNQFGFVALPPQSKLVDFPLIAGRWLQPGDENVMVANHELIEHEPSIAVGDEVTIQVGGKTTRWTVVGIVQEAASIPTAYVNQAYFEKLTAQQGFAINAMIVTEKHDAASQAAVSGLVENSLSNAGLGDVLRLSNIANRQLMIDEHLVVISSFLLFMAALIAVVGGLGLLSTMSVNVLERMREIGVMRAIGASNRAVQRIIVVEGLIIGLLSWLIAVAITTPIGIVIGNAFSMTLIQVAIQYVVDPAGLLLWLAVVLVFSAAASYYPAQSAAELSVNQILAYE